MVPFGRVGDFISAASAFIGSRPNAGYVRNSTLGQSWQFSGGMFKGRDGERFG
jgi:hypothetical protein